MDKLSNFTEAEQTTVLRFVQILAGEMNTAKKAPAAFSMDLTEDESVAQAGQHAREVAARRAANQGGRYLVDATDEDKEIRAGIKDWLRRTSRLKYYGVRDEKAIK